MNTTINYLTETAAAAKAETAAKVTTPTVVQTIAEQKAALTAEKYASFNDFCVMLCKTQYCLTITKNMLIEQGMTDDEYKVLTAQLVILRTLLVDYKVRSETYTKSPTDERKAGLEKVRSAVYDTIKNIKSMFCVSVNATAEDINYLCNAVFAFKYADRSAITKGYTVSVISPIRLLNIIFKLQSVNMDKLSDERKRLIESRTTAKACNTIAEFDAKYKAVCDAKAAKTSKTSKTAKTAKTTAETAAK